MIEEKPKDELTGFYLRQSLFSSLEKLISNAVATKKNFSLLLFDLEEQEAFLQSKANCLLHTVLTQEAKKRAYDYPTATQIA